MSDKDTLIQQNCRKKSDDTAGKSSLLRSWGDKDPLKRPSCALLVSLAQAILRHADAHTLTTIVSSRQGSCLHELSHTRTSRNFLLYNRLLVHVPATHSQSHPLFRLQFCQSTLSALSAITDSLVCKYAQTAWCAKHAHRLHGCSSVCCFVVQTLFVIAA